MCLHPLLTLILDVESRELDPAHNAEFYVGRACHVAIGAMLSSCI